MVLPELNYKGHIGSVEVSIEDACLHGRILFIDDLVAYEGDSVPRIQKAFQEAVNRYLAHCQRVGKPANKPYSGSFNVRIGPELHSKAAKIAYQKKIKLNEFVKRAVQSSVNKDGVITHEHRHQHIVNVTVESTGARMTKVAGMGTPSWESPDVRLQ